MGIRHDHTTIWIPYGGSVTVQFNPYSVIEHQIIRCVLCVNALWVGLWKYVPLTPDILLTLTLTYLPRLMVEND